MNFLSACFLVATFTALFAALIWAHLAEARDHPEADPADLFDQTDRWVASDWRGKATIHRR